MNKVKFPAALRIGALKNPERQVVASDRIYVVAHGTYYRLSLLSVSGIDRAAKKQYRRMLKRERQKKAKHERIIHSTDR